MPSSICRSTPDFSHLNHKGSNTATTFQCRNVDSPMQNYPASAAAVVRANPQTTTSGLTNVRDTQCYGDGCLPACLHYTGYQCARWELATTHECILSPTPPGSLSMPASTCHMGISDSRFCHNSHIIGTAIHSCLRLFDALPCRLIVLIRPSCKSFAFEQYAT